MNDLIERYVSAVCLYFFGRKRTRIYNELKNQILSSVEQYDDLEDLLLNYGHPRSLALSYGYRPIIHHIFNPKIVLSIQKYVYSFSFIYLVFSTLYYLQQLYCLPFQATHTVASSIYTSSVIAWLLSYPFYFMGAIACLSGAALIFLDYRYPVSQDYKTKWDAKELNQLPHPSQYPSHYFESFFMILFTLYFLVYSIFFKSNTILEIQHASSQMIHLMTYFFQPFIAIIYLDYLVDITKKIYTKRYLKYSIVVNVFNVVALSTFIINSQFLKDFLLPLDISYLYILVDIFSVGALVLLYMISLYKLARNIKSYRSLYRK